MSTDKDKKDKSPTIEELANEDKDTPDQDKKPTSGKSVFEWIVTTPSPNKTLDSYGEHVLNYDGDESTSRIIRGTEGLLGNLDKASLDIVVGIFKKIAGLFKKSETT